MWDLYTRTETECLWKRTLLLCYHTHVCATNPSGLPHIGTYCHLIEKHGQGKRNTSLLRITRSCLWIDTNSSIFFSYCYLWGFDTMSYYIAQVVQGPLCSPSSALSCQNPTIDWLPTSGIINMYHYACFKAKSWILSMTLCFFFQWVASTEITSPNPCLHYTIYKADWLMTL